MRLHYLMKGINLLFYYVYSVIRWRHVGTTGEGVVLALVEYSDQEHVHDVQSFLQYLRSHVTRSFSSLRSR